MMFAMILRDTLGLRIKQIPGYPDSNAINLAIERGEIDGPRRRLFINCKQSPAMAGARQSRKATTQFGRSSRHTNLPDAPTAREVVLADKRSLLSWRNSPI